jgi:hypothetical protein
MVFVNSNNKPHVANVNTKSLIYSIHVKTFNLHDVKTVERQSSTFFFWIAAHPLMQGYKEVFYGELN